MRVDALKEHPRQVHTVSLNLVIRERAAVKEDLDDLLLDVVPRDERPFRRVLREANATVDLHDVLEGRFTDAMVHINGVDQRIDKVGLGSVEVTNFVLVLQAL